MKLFKKSITLAILLGYFLTTIAYAVNSFSEVSEQVSTWQKPETPTLIEEGGSSAPILDISPAGKAKFTIIDKKNGKVNNLIIPVGSSNTYETLIINVHQCLQEHVRRYNRENKALLEIFNFTNSTAAERKFYGWMFSNSPESSTLAHERFDVTLATCEE